MGSAYMRTIVCMAMAMGTSLGGKPLSVSLGADAIVRERGKETTRQDTARSRDGEASHSRLVPHLSNPTQSNPFVLLRV